MRGEFYQRLTAYPSFLHGHATRKHLFDLCNYLYYLKNTNDPYRESQNSIGTGCLAFAGRFYDVMKWFLDDESNKMYQFWLDDPYMAPYTYTLCLSKEESDAIADIKTACNTMVSTESLKFIMGTRPLSEYGDFVKELKKLGAEKIEEIYNEAYQNSLK